MNHAGIIEVGGGREEGMGGGGGREGGREGGEERGVFAIMEPFHGRVSLCIQHSGHPQMIRVQRPRMQRPIHSIEDANALLHGFRGQMESAAINQQLPEDILGFAGHHDALLFLRNASGFLEHRNRGLLVAALKTQNAHLQRHQQGARVREPQLSPK